MNKKLLLGFLFSVFVVSTGFLIQSFDKNLDLYVVPLSMISGASLIAIAIAGLKS